MNEYLAKLRELNFKNRSPQGTPKTFETGSKVGFEGFEGGLGCHVLENALPGEGAEKGLTTGSDTTTDRRDETIKYARVGYPQNLQNPYGLTVAALRQKCPDLVPEGRWRQCLADADSFVAQWGQQAAGLGWSSRDLFGLMPIPAHVRPSFNRMSRYDHLGLVWCLEGRCVTAMSSHTAAIHDPTTGSTTVTVFRLHNRPALGPLGDSLDDFKA